jgi:hypothetical protein
VWHNLWYDETEKTIRGSFINLMITIIYLGLIITGSFVSLIASNLKEMETLLIGIFVSSIGLWAGKKSIEFVKKMGIENILSKNGLNMDDLTEAGETLRYKRTNGTSIKTSDVNDSEQRRLEREEAK